MAIQIQGNSGVIADVDGTQHRALKVTSRPINYGSLGIYKCGAVTGTIAAALGANSEIFQFRWPEASNLCLVNNVEISAGANVAAGAAALAAFRMTVARSWTVAGSGGTRITLPANTNKLRTSMGSSLVNDIGMATTGALTAGTKTLDAQDFSAIAFGIGTGAITTAVNLSLISLTHLWDWNQEGNHPLVLAQNEGFVIRTGAAFPTTMTWHAAVHMSWAEVASY